MSAYLSAQQANPGTPPNARDIFAALARGRMPSGAAAPAAAAAVDSADPGAICGLLDRAELLGVIREPIAWVFTLAERSARGDAVDLAAIARVRDAVLHRVDAIIAGAVASEPPRIRAADLLTVFSLLIGTLDPGLVRAAVQTLGGSLVEALGALWPIIPSTADDAEDAHGSCCGSCGGPCAQPPGAAHLYFTRIAPFAEPYAGMFGTPHMPRPQVPPWYWSLGRFPL